MGNDRRSPLLKITAALILGVAIFFQAEEWTGGRYAFYISVALLHAIKFSPWSVSFTHRWVPGMFIYLSLILGGYAWAETFSTKRSDRVLVESLPQGKVAVVLELGSYPRLNGRYARAEARVTSLLDSNSQVRRVDLTCLAYFRADSAVTLPRSGDRVLATAQLSTIHGPQNPHEFDLRRYMEGRNISIRTYLDTNNWRVVGHERHFINDLAEKCRHHLLGKFHRAGLAGEEMALASSLLLGDKDGLEQDLKDTFSAAGAMHVLCVSGLHVGILFVVFDFLLKGLGRRGKGKIARGILLVLIIWFYALLTGLSPSVTRASLMFSLLQAGRLMKNPPPTLNSLAGSALLQVMMDPLVITHVGFQLSYLAVAAIVQVTPLIQSLWQPRFKPLSWIWGLSVVSVVAQLGTGPLAMHLFHSFPSWFLLTNLIVIPLATVIIYLALAILAVPFPGFYELLGDGLSNILRLLAGSVRMVEGLPGSVIDGIYFSSWSVLMVYVVLWLSLQTITRRHKGYLITALLAAVILSSILDTTRYQNAARKAICIYHVRDHTIIDIMQAGKCLSLVSADSIPERTYSFSVEPNRIASQVRNVDTVVLGSDSLYDASGFFYRRGFVAASGLRAYIAGRDYISGPGAPVAVDVLIITGGFSGDIVELLEGFPTSKVIIDSSVPFWKADRYPSLCDSLGVDYHSVRREGAYLKTME